MTFDLRHLVKSKKRKRIDASAMAVNVGNIPHVVEKRRKLEKTEQPIQTVPKVPKKRIESLPEIPMDNRKTIRSDDIDFDNLKDVSDELPMPSKDYTKHEYVLMMIDRILLQWKHIVKSTRVNTEVVKIQQTEKWIKPLVDQLKDKSLPDKQLNPIHEVFECLAAKEFKKADDVYLNKLAVGQDLWLLGVTMVGIHTRKSREKIKSEKIHHLLNDETIRKYVLSIKRLMSHVASRV